MSETNPGATSGTQAQPQQIQVTVRDDKAQTSYSNMWTVRPTPSAEEIVIDFGVAVPNPERQDQMTLDVSSRIILNYYRAKLLALQLSQIVQRYEQQFGTLELDLRRRFKQG